MWQRIRVVLLDAPTGTLITTRPVACTGPTSFHRRVAMTASRVTKERAMVSDRRKQRVVTKLETETQYRLGDFLGAGGFGSVWMLAAPRRYAGRACIKLTRDQPSWHREAYLAELTAGHPRVL